MVRFRLNQFGLVQAKPIKRKLFGSEKAKLVKPKLVWGFSNLDRTEPNWIVTIPTSCVVFHGANTNIMWQYQTGLWQYQPPPTPHLFCDNTNIIESP